MGDVMPIVTDINKESGIVIHTVSGEVSLEEFKQTTVNLFTNPDFDPSFSIILDISNASLKNLSSIDIVELASFIAQFNPKRGQGNSYIVATEDLEYGLSRMLQGHMGTSERSITIYRTLEEALTTAYYSKTS